MPKIKKGNKKMNDYEYFIEQHRLVHQKNPSKFNGKSLIEWIPTIDNLIIKYRCDSILDYGCGQATYWPENWRAMGIQGYDPCVERFATEPKPADLVFCVDVLEHIPESATDSVLSRINQLANKIAFVEICFHPANRNLPDGKSNIHVNVQSREWWFERLKPYPKIIFC